MQQLNHWQIGYSVFVKEIDDQHKQLIDILNELYDAYINNLHPEKVNKTIDQLMEYATVHFATEEKYFKQFGYKETDEHVEDHRLFLIRVEAFRLDYKKNKTILSLQIINFLQEWIKHHIRNVDKKYITCFKNNGLK
jgi:hemerythrin-like metal-binding protein